MTNTIRASVDLVAEPWIGSPYYDEAEKWTFIFWDEGRIFRRFFDRLDLDSVIELACGHGRHAQIIQDKVGKLTLMDVLEENIVFCQRRLGSNPRLAFLKNDGHTFQPIEPDSVTAIFCYDAMVHFSPDIVASYVADAHRVLKPGGHALFHHSNYSAPLDRHYGQNPHARNHMTFELFQEIAEAGRMAIVASEAMPWGNVPDLDRLSLLRKG
jgi:SAM-dependent methyltransferase